MSMASKHWNIVSSWSKAGIATSIVLELNKIRSSNSEHHTSTKTQRIVFDIGATPSFEEAIPAKHVFVSHGHLDHVGALFSHARAHAVAYVGESVTYFVPAQLLSKVEHCREAMSNLDALNLNQESNAGDNEGRKTSLLSMNLVPVHDGDEISLKGINYDSKTSFFMRAFAVDHAGHPALAYVIGSRTRSGIKTEYQHLGHDEIRQLVKSGVSIKSDPIENIEIAYTGDTCANGLIKIGNDYETAEGDASSTSCGNIGQLFQAELLLCELTFLDFSDDEGQRSKAIERGHIHINDIERIFSSHISTWCDKEVVESDGRQKKKLVFYHLSAKYQPGMRALDMIIEGLPNQLMLYYDCYVAIFSMLDDYLKIRDPEQIDGPDDEMRKLFLPRSGCISIEMYQRWKKGNVVA